MAGSGDKRKKKSCSIRIQEDTLDHFRELAKETGLKTTDLMRRVLEKFQKTGGKV